MPVTPGVGPRLLALAIAVAALAPAATASQPLLPWEFEVTLDAPPRVGDAVTLTVTLHARMDMRDTRLRLDLPEWVTPERGTEWVAGLPDGERATWTWTVTPERAGFWAAGVSLLQEGRDEPAAWWCCVHAYSAAGDGSRSAREPEDAVPAVDADARLDLAPVDAGTVRVTQRVTPAAGWLAHADLRAALTTGGRTLAEDVGPGSAPVSASGDLPLAAGETAVVTAWASAIVTFEGGPGDPTERHVDVACRNVEVTRDADGRVREADAWTCLAQAAPSSPAGAFVAAVVAGLGLAAAGGVAMIRWRRGA